MTTALDTFLTPRISIHGQPCLEASGLTKAECQAIRAVVCNNYMSHDDYRMKQPAHPFVQGYDEEYSGWVLVEFWGQDYHAYVEYLRTRLPQAIQVMELGI